LYGARPRAVKHSEPYAGATDFVVDDGQVRSLWRFAGHQFQVIEDLLAGFVQQQEIGMVGQCVVEGGPSTRCFAGVQASCPSLTRALKSMSDNG
jgi:hypothetical protein